MSDYENQNGIIAPIINFLETRDWVAEETEFMLLQDDIILQMETAPVGAEAICTILALMERYPLVEFGAPGALTHFMEGFYKDAPYDELILTSVQKVPGVHTVFLLNRLINGSSREKASEYLEVMQMIHSNSDLHTKIRNTAKHFWEYHGVL